MSSAVSSESSTLAELTARLQANAASRGHRAVVVLHGEQNWCRESAMAILSRCPLPRLVCLGESFPEVDTLGITNARQLLGQELNGVVVDAWSGFDAEAFGAVAGTLQAGGVMLLLTPHLSQWHEYPDPEHERLAVTPYTIDQISGRFLQYISRVILESDGITLLGQDEPLPDVTPETSACWQPPFLADGITAEQSGAVAAIEKVVHGHRRRPLVLTSDRGRGKSTALGIAAAALLKTSTQNIVVTAPRLAAVAQIFAHAQSRLPGAESQRGLLQWQGKRIEFIPPDALTLSPSDTELLLVDEAAAIPTPLLAKMLEQYSRIVFASTIHGYEGTGRGFALRFQKVLAEKTPGWRSQYLSQPVRWAEGDPLEQLSFHALMLNAEPVDVESLSGIEHGNFEWIQRDRLIDNQQELAELFGLLVLAHYRTSPNDLRYLLDGPNVRIAVLRHQGHIIATALIAEEGGLPEVLAQEIYEGRRRAHGHLLPQSLAVHAGFPEAPQLLAWRVVRIAVHPALMRRGLGASLLQRLQHEASRSGVDYLGASFGGDEPLFAFWHKSGWLPVRVGLSREAASGTHAVMVMQGVSPAGEQLSQQLQLRLAEQLPHILAEPLADFDVDLAGVIFQALPALPLGTLNRRDWQDIISFAENLRGYEVCSLALWRLTSIALSDTTLQARLDNSQRHLLVQKVMQRQEWSVVAKGGGLNGRAQVVAALRDSYRVILNYYRETGVLPAAS